jgi:repressor of nif and glnA expression
MKKIVRLTESDLTRIVKRVINEDDIKIGSRPASEYILDYLNDRGGSIGERDVKDVMKDLRELEKEIKLFWFKNK